MVSYKKIIYLIPLNYYFSCHLEFIYPPDCPLKPWRKWKF